MDFPHIVIWMSPFSFFVALGVIFNFISLFDERNEEGKDQELIQSSTTPDPGHRMEM